MAPAPRQPVVLIVDDDDDALEMYTFGLEAGGCTVLSARGVAEAWELARDHAPDVVVTDVRLGANCGIQLAQRLRADERCAQAAIILLTGDVRAGDRAPRHAYERLLLKPCTPAALLDEVRRLLVAASVRPGA